MENMDFATGALLTAQTEEALAQIKREAHRRKPVPPNYEPSEGAVIKALTDAAMPSVRRDAKSLQRVTAENEIQRRKDEQAWARERMSLPQEF